jgi:hypothetical protein
LKISRGGIGVCKQNIRNPEIFSVELLIDLAHHRVMKVVKNYLILCLLLVMPLQSIAANFQLACQDNHKTSVTTEKKMSHCHQSQAKVHKQSKEIQSHNGSHHCLSFCAQVGMAALTSDSTLIFSQDSDIIYNSYLHHYDSVILPHFQRPPISFS